MTLFFTYAFVIGMMHLLHNIFDDVFVAQYIERGGKYCYSYSEMELGLQTQTSRGCGVKDLGIFPKDLTAEST